MERIRQDRGYFSLYVLERLILLQFSRVCFYMWTYFRRLDFQRLLVCFSFKYKNPNLDNHNKKAISMHFTHLRVLCVPDSSEVRIRQFILYSSWPRHFPEVIIKVIAREYGVSVNEVKLLLLIEHDYSKYLKITYTLDVLLLQLWSLNIGW